MTMIEKKAFLESRLAPILGLPNNKAVRALTRHLVRGAGRDIQKIECVQMWSGLADAVLDPTMKDPTPKIKAVIIDLDLVNDGKLSGCIHSEAKAK